MIVSRADIVTDQIVQFPKNAFLRLNIGTYLNEIGIEPLPSQIAMINGINNPKYRFGCGALSRRQGKTFIANVIGQVVALVPGSAVLVMAPNYMLSQISFDLQRDLIKKFGLEVAVDNKKDRLIELSNGSTIRIGSVNQVDSCVGRSYDLIIFDEAALTDGMDAFNVALRPTLDKPNSKAIFISTPRGKNNWFAKLFERGFDDNFPDWLSVKATYKDNPRMTQSDIDSARASMTDAEFRQEYEADFTIYEGKIWNLPEESIVEFDGNMDNCEVVGGIDLGFRDPTAMCVVVYNWDTECFHIVDEYQDKEQNTAKQAAQIKKLMDNWNCDYMFIDSANQQQRYDFAQIYDIPTNNAKKDKLAGIGYIGALCENSNILVDPKCTHCLHTFDQYRWDANENLLKEKPIHDEASHMADAIRYAIYSYKQTSGGF